jgi:hypothetical protein
MSAKEIIIELQNVLEERDGEDLEVTLDVDFQFRHCISHVAYLADLNDEPDHIVISSISAVEEIDKYDAGLFCTADEVQWN